MSGLSDPAAAAAAYAKEMASTAAVPQANGGPAFDIILLGTGDDGHCASINPGTDEAKASATSGPWVLPLPAGDKPGGITVSHRLINNAARVVVSAGEKKRATMVKRALTGKYEPYGCPAGEVKATAGTTTWIVDVESIAEYKAAH